MDQIKLAAQGKLFGCLSTDGRFVEFRRQGLIVRFDLTASVQAGRAVLVEARVDEAHVRLLSDEQARTSP